MFAQRLRGLATAGVLSKRFTPSDPPVIDYALTVRGEGLMPVLEGMEAWAGESLAEAREAAERLRPQVRTRTVDHTIMPRTSLPDSGCASREGTSPTLARTLRTRSTSLTKP